MPNRRTTARVKGKMMKAMLGRVRLRNSVTAIAMMHRKPRIPTIASVIICNLFLLVQRKRPDLPHDIQNGPIPGSQYGYHLFLPFQIVRGPHQCIRLLF